MRQVPSNVQNRPKCCREGPPKNAALNEGPVSRRNFNRDNTYFLNTAQRGGVSGGGEPLPGCSPGDGISGEAA